MPNAEMLGIRRFDTATCVVRYSLALPASLQDNVREIHDVKSGMKGKRHGSKLMELVCSEADRLQKILILLPDSVKLEKWYNGFGFETVQSEPVSLMARNPKQPAEIAARGKHGR